MAIRYDPILGKVLQKEDDLELLRQEVKTKAPLHHTHSVGDIKDLPQLEFADKEDIEQLFA